MKYLAIFFISLFMTFIVMPTVVILIENDADISYVYTFTEEEENSSSSEKETSHNISWKLIPKSDVSIVNPNELQFGEYFHYILGNNIHYSETFSPPPEIS
ncbi:hypothetical protein [Mesonia sp. K7]|uniref:hypothetical protein n=1 Tax=Mesonia sp. K7 TaxID=2218606 RepID=UPI000DA75B57|nr:hypothetical protein [Mesonia sp. K7]PZD79029.1 hypothetical protein DNG35_03205 [Mesonia sp. K7]